MDTPPPIPDQAPEPRAPARFNLPPSAWLAWAIYAALSIGLFSIRHAQADAYRIGELVGGIIGALLIPVVIALIVWRLAGRSASAGNTTFIVVFALLVAGQVSQFSRRAEANAGLDKLKKDQELAMDEQRQAMAQGHPYNPDKAEKSAVQVATKLGELAESSTGRDRTIAEAGKVFVNELLATKKRYDDAVTALDMANFWALAKFTPGEPANARRAAIRRFAQINGELATYQDTKGTSLQKILTAHGASPGEVSEALEGYHHSGGSRLALVEKIRETDAKLAAVMLDFVDFADSNHEHWQVEASTGKIIFTDQALLTRYNDLLKRMNAIGVEQAEYRNKVVALKPGQ